MSRALERATGPIDVADQEASTGRTTARALATAIALLLVSILVVTRSSAALGTRDAETRTSFRAGSVELEDDDRGTSLFAIDDMAPGQPVRDCIAVSYRGNIMPVVVSLSAEAQGPLASLLDVRVERGTGGSFGECRGFVPEATVFQGTLAGLAGLDRPVPAFTVRRAPAERTFRFTFRLADLPESVAATDAPTASARFVWAADPAP